MAETRAIKLSRPISWHGEMLTTLTLKEPKGSDYVELGEPRLLVRQGDGFYFVDQPHIVKAYLERCIDHEAGNFLLALMSLRDTQKTKAALLDFFTDATEAAGASPSQTSSGASASSP
jgi:hypothetical protein